MSSHRESAGPHMLTLKDLLAHFAPAAVSPLHGTAPADKQDCPICLQNFSTQQESSDVTESPCQPMLLHGCNHVIGGTCLTKLLQANILHCPLCRKSIERVTGSTPIPYWLCWLLETNQFPFSSVTLWIVMARPELVSETDEQQLEVREFDELHLKLFMRDLSPDERKRLWKMYMRAPSTDTPLAVVFVAGIVAALWVVEYILRLVTSSSSVPGCNQVLGLIKLMGLNRKSVLFLIGVATLFLGDKYATMPRNAYRIIGPRYLAIALFTVSAMCLARALPLWLLFLVSVSDCLMFGVVVWMLLGFVTSKRKGQ
ncbi:hypothetical protein EK21DRAFT_113153 [Setomelanomma holmii]|uniref:RING-type domain-containing protein n=1 Tax=Setomelanomma holmii TaxID=210430 RepID=A0A9P4H8S4_9PLEO|nr:hypothetical protein EK21DRAFT_113153 [Setomelanomma holmii]